MSTRKKNKPQKQKNSKILTRKPMPSKPPAFDAKIVKRQRFRFTLNTPNNTTSGTTTISYTDLFFLTGLVVSTTQRNSAFESIILNKIQLWQTGSASTSGGPTSVTFSGPGTISLKTDTTSQGGIGSKDISLTDTSYNANSFAKLTFVPPKNSVFAMWQSVGATSSTTANSTITIAAINGDIMDIVITYVQADQNTTYLTQTTTGLTGPGTFTNPNIPLSGTIGTDPVWIPFSNF